jgi:hypothetical protein
VAVSLCCIVNGDKVSVGAVVKEGHGQLVGGKEVWIIRCRGFCHRGRKPWVTELQCTTGHSYAWATTNVEVKANS